MSEEKKEKDYKEDLQEEMAEDITQENKDIHREEELAQGQSETEEFVHEDSLDACDNENIENEEADAPESSEKSEKKGFFKKDKKPDKKDVLIEELTDKYKRTLAEFENFRKRSEKEKSAMFEVGAKDMIEKILPVVDNFERGMATVPPEEKESPFVDGMDKIYKQLMKAVDRKPVIFQKEFDMSMKAVENLPYTVEKASDGVYVVEGPKIDKMLGYTNLDSEKGFEFFQKFLKNTGILDDLEEAGIEEGDTVRMYGLEFDYYK